MSFCGSKQGSLSVKEGVLQNKCFVDVMNIIPHGLLILITVTILIAWRQSVIGKLHAKIWVHYQCHNARWIFTLALLLVICLEIAEGFVSDYLDPDTSNYHVIVPPCLAFFSTILSIIFYHNIEMWNSPRFLLVLLPYWLSASALKLLKAFSLYRHEINSSHMRLWLTWTSVILYACLLVTELHVFITQRYACFKKAKKVQPPAELANTRYYANYCNFLSGVTFWWMNDILIDGYKAPLDSETLGKLPITEKALPNYRCILQVFEEEKEKAAKKNALPSLHKIYLKAFWRPLLLAAVFRFVGDLLAFIGPMCIQKIVDFAYAELEAKSQADISTTPATVTYSPVSLSNQTIKTNNTADQVPTPEFYVSVNTFINNGYGLCVLLFVSTLVQHSLLQNHHYIVIRQGVRLRSALQTMIYNKSLRLSSLGITGGKTTIGQIMNHMTMDTTFLQMLFFFLHYIWATPVQIIIALVLMYYKLGISAVVGGIIIILSAPIQVYIGRGMSNMQKKVMQQADKRVKKTNEMIQGIKVIKLLAWETFMCRSITDERKRELKFLLINGMYRASFSFIGTAVPALATMATFVMYAAVSDEPITAGKALSTLALFNILSIPLILFTVFITSLILANVSCGRLIPYFLADEVEGAAGASDTMKTGADSLVGDGDNMELQTFGGSTCSLTSRHSYHNHSRQNSSSSLLEIGTNHSVATPAVLFSGDQPHHHRSSRSSKSNDETDFMELHAIEVCDGTFSWDLKTREPSLHNINLLIPAGKLTIIVGSVGSGKSSLLSALLGEMLTVSGNVHWTRSSSTAYVSQKPWLLNKSLKDNILFGSHMVHTRWFGSVYISREHVSFLPSSWLRYQKVLEACALQPDIAMLPAGDCTEIGEKGVNLSGGQKQRVSIARALYSPADTVIMDDPFSALDAHVGRHVFDDVILRKLIRRKKTVILVTHQLQYLSHAHSVVVMKDGKIEYQGKLAEVKKINPELYESWRVALKEAKSAEVKNRNNSEILLDGTIDHLPEVTSRQTSLASQKSTDVMAESDKENESSNCAVASPVTMVSETPSENHKTKVDDDNKDDETKDTEDKGATGKLIKKEHKEVGAVSFSIYLCHLRACGFPLVLLVILLLLANQALLVGTNFWITIWAGDATLFVDTQPVNSTETFLNENYVSTYVALSITAVVITIVAGIVLQFTGVRGSQYLHNTMLHRVSRVPVRFFDTNPSGRIINRFSADMAQIDQKIPNTWDAFLRVALQTVAAIVVNCIGTPYFIFAAVPVAILYYCLQNFYRATARELQRLDSVTKSPIFSHFAETLSGLQTIRAYKAENRFRRQALAAIDANVVPYLYNQTANRWLGIRLDYMGAFLVFASAISSLSAGLAGQTSPAIIGLCIAYGLMVSNYMNWIVRNSSELEMMMNAVERVDEYTKLETETTAVEEGTRESGWPTEGNIEYRNVSLSYDAKLDAVVKGISFSINSGEKIGICGRTGSGKSSLTLSMFRMIDIIEGEILIDGRNIAHISLPYLRSKLAIIPQDPILFTGSIRYNLAPAGDVSDDQMWTALESVQLKDMIEALPQQLDANVSEGGDNFSVGQKQLFCLARAFLRDNKVIVLDEATASIDLETDNKLQTVVSSVFQNKTVITIAHRISTIMKYDRVMVMESGKILEFAPPQQLIENDDSHFAQLVKQSYK